MKKISVILDPAHGSNVKGKSSPDGKHKEYIWSRMIANKLAFKLRYLGYEVLFTTESELEIGLTKRKQIADNLVITKGNVKLLVSNHNNAAGAGDKWLNASGVEIWTSKGKSLSDVFAGYIVDSLAENFKEDKAIKFRYDESDGDKDKEENFTVLMGNYYAILIEWLFQDNLYDVKRLADDATNDKYVDAVINGIEKCNEFITKKLG